MAKTLWEKIEAKFADLKAELSGKAPGVKDAASEKLISDLQTEITDGKEENADQAEQITAKDKTIGELNAKVFDLENKVKAKDLKITELEAKDKSAGEKAADLVAATGVDIRDLPAAGAPAGGEAAGAKKSLKRQYLDIVATKDSVKAAKFYAAHSKKPEFWQ